MYSPLIDILFGDFIISKKIHLWNFYFYRTHVNYNSLKYGNSSIKTLTIEGNGFTINGSNQYRFLDIQTGTTVNINNLTITNCHSDGDGGAIYNNGTLNIYNSNLTQNTATGHRT